MPGEGEQIQTRRVGLPVGLYVGAARDDPLSGVPRPRLADRLGPDRSPMQNHDRPGERIWKTVGRSQRGSGHGPRLPGEQSAVANLLAKCRPLPELATP